MSTALLLGGCSSGPREVEGTPPTDDAAVSTCEGLIAKLPESIAGLKSIELSNGDGWAAAWGDPAIVLRCGVAESPALVPTSQCIAVNDIDWFATQDGAEADLSNLRDATVDMTTVGRSVNVEVSVPAKWQPPGDALLGVADAIRATTEAVDPCQ
jgi:hypothetical protein